VTITKPYYIGKYEVTVAQWRAFAEASTYQTEAEKANKGWGWKDGTWGEASGLTWRTPGFEQTPDHPVVLITWNDAQEFCKWASNVAHASGFRGEIRLPSEAQWEYAARGPESRKYPWGAKKDWTLLNHADAAMRSAGITQKWGSSPFNDGHAYTAPAGSYKNAASWCGAFDMAGNVWEWVADCFDARYYRNSPAVDPPGPSKGKNRVRRGGSWNPKPDHCRAACRLRSTPWSRGADSGFRCALDF
jgi:formylglycine-generating enzyme required for sulfatase activity